MTAIMDLSFPGQRTITASSCIPHDSVYMPGPRAGKSENGFFVVIPDSKYYKMTPKFVKQKSHRLHSSIKFANPSIFDISTFWSQQHMGCLSHEPNLMALAPKSLVVRWQSISSSTQKVIGLTPVGSSRMFSSEPPLSLTEKKKHLSHVFTRLKIHHQISNNIEVRMRPFTMVKI